MNSRFTVELSSDLDYEEMVVHISLDEEPIATINCEKGLDNLEIELSPMCEEKNLSIALEDYLHTLMFAKKTLIQAQKKD